MHGTRRVLLAGAATLGLALVQLPPPAMARAAAMPSDFNGDGYADLAIGVPGEDIGSKDYAGAVNVLYGSKTGLTASGDQHWSQASPGVKGKAQKDDYFGSALASGDFDGDGYADLAIGVPYDHVGDVHNAGAVNILYGSKRGLTAAGDQRWSRANLPGPPQKNGSFGQSLASGDFNGDGRWDLAIGVREGDGDHGSVIALLGSPEGLISKGATSLRRSMTGAPPVDHAEFGATLAAGDLDGDGRDDLAVGSGYVGCTTPSGDCPRDQGDAGVFYGGPVGLTAEGCQLFSQDSPGIEDDAEDWDSFGRSLAIGDFDGDGVGDLAVGVPGELQPACPSCGEGAVNILYGSPDGLTSAGSRIFYEPDPGVPPDDYDDRFGSALAAGDFDGDGQDDLAIGAPWEAQRWGVVFVLYGAGAGLSAEGYQRWSQDSPGVPGTSEDRDGFGSELASADYGRSGRDDLAIGAPREKVGRAAAGRVTVLYGRAPGLSARHAQAWSQNSPGVKDRSEARDYFGRSLTP